MYIPHKSIKDELNSKIHAVIFCFDIFCTNSDEELRKA
jgi:hypothetical protein